MSHRTGLALQFIIKLYHLGLISISNSEYLPRSQLCGLKDQEKKKDNLENVSYYIDQYVPTIIPM